MLRAGDAAEPNAVFAFDRNGRAARIIIRRRCVDCDGMARQRGAGSNEVAWEPTVGARFMARVYAATCDAWTVFDPVAVAFASGRALKGEGGAANPANNAKR